MARVLQFHPHPGFRVPGYPNTHHDEARVAREAGLRGLTPEEYVAGALAYHWPDGRPAFTVSAHAPEPLAAVEPPVAAPEPDAEGLRRRKP